MFRILLLAALALAACKGGDNPRNTPHPSLATGRSPEDISRDALRKPGEVMDFFGIAPGQQVLELMSGAGYYADQLSRRVGPKGKVYAQNNQFILNLTGKVFAARLENPELANVQRMDVELDAMELPKGLDAVVMILFYHDTYWMKTDRAAMNRKVFEALKPGGVYGIVDHSAHKGDGTQHVRSLHRVEESLVVEEVKAAGFELAGTSDLLRHAEDKRDYNVFKPPAGRDKTDRFVLKFVKPATE